MSVFNTSVTTVFLGPYLTAVAEDAAGADGKLPFLGLGIPPGSWFSYVLSASVLLQVLVLPLTGAVADRTGRKREMLAGFAMLGALATTLMFFIADGRYAARRGAVHRRQHRLRRGHRRLLLLAPRPRRARRARRRLQPRLGVRLRRRGAAARHPPRARARRRGSRPDHRRGGADLPGHRRPLVGRVHGLHRVPAAQPPGPRSGRRAVAQRLPPAGRDHARDAGLPADPVVPRRVPAVQRRRPDRHRAVGDLRDRGARPRAGRCSPARS